MARTPKSLLEDFSLWKSRECFSRGADKSESCSEEVDGEDELSTARSSSGSGQTQFISFCFLSMLGEDIT